MADIAYRRSYYSHGAYIVQIINSDIQLQSILPQRHTKAAIFKSTDQQVIVSIRFFG